MTKLLTAALLCLPLMGWAQKLNLMTALQASQMVDAATISLNQSINAQDNIMAPQINDPPSYSDCPASEYEIVPGFYRGPNNVRTFCVHTTNKEGADHE